MVKHTTLIKNAKTCLFIAAIVAGSSVGLFAQDEVVAAEKAPVTLFGMYKQGGWAMIPLTALSIAALGLTIYNVLTVREKNIVGKAFIDNEIMPVLREQDVEKAHQICQENPNPVNNILASGFETILSTGQLDPKNFDDATAEAAAMQLAKPYLFINGLQIVASVSPMVGLLGTVSGMVKAFQSIASEGMGKPELLAGNISEALVTTASGLIVAVPALIAYFIFKNVYGKLTSSVGQVIGQSMRALLMPEAYSGNTAPETNTEAEA